MLIPRHAVCSLLPSRSCMTPESMAVYEPWQQPHCLGAKPINYSWVIAEVSGAPSASCVVPFNGCHAAEVMGHAAGVMEQ